MTHFLLLFKKHCSSHKKKTACHEYLDIWASVKEMAGLHIQVLRAMAAIFVFGYICCIWYSVVVPVWEPCCVFFLSCVTSSPWYCNPCSLQSVWFHCAMTSFSVVSEVISSLWYPGACWDLQEWRVLMLLITYNIKVLFVIELWTLTLLRVLSHFENILIKMSIWPGRLKLLPNFTTSKLLSLFSTSCRQKLDIKVGYQLKK